MISSNRIFLIMLTGFSSLLSISTIAAPEEEIATDYFYLGAKTGISYSPNQCKDSCDTESPMFSLFAGYNIGTHGAIEIETTHLFVKSDSTNTTQSSIDLYSLKYKKDFNINKNILYVQGGAGYWQQDLNSPTGSSSSYSISPLIGFGYERMLPKTRLKLRVGYEYIDSIGGKETDEHLAFIGISYQFDNCSACNNHPPLDVTPAPLPLPVVVTEIKPSPVIEVCFSESSSDLSDYYKNQMDAFYDTLNSQAHIRVDGFADKHGSIEYNKKLVRNRINSIIDYLKSRTSSGEQKRLSFETVDVSNVDIRHDSDALNRCAEIILIQ